MFDYNKYAFKETDNIKELKLKYKLFNKFL
jgi:hypothetical protein